MSTQWPRRTVQQIEAERRARKVMSMILSGMGILVFIVMLVLGFGFVETTIVMLLLSILSELVEINANLRR